MLLSAVSVLVDAQSISEVPEGLINDPVHRKICRLIFFRGIQYKIKRYVRI
jgi:hypothetical protein